MKTLLCIAIATWSLVSAAAAQAVAEMRITPTEVMRGDKGDSQIGSSKLAGIHTKVLSGNPAAAGFYSILLFVPAHTTIQAHSHRDERMASVISGNWQFGYGTHFDEAELKSLPPGSVYSEPAGTNHFARTTDQPVVVHICGFGPTDTRYFDPANEPRPARGRP
jgi:quercetin dioxygenase-like cupin family protein